LAARDTYQYNLVWLRLLLLIASISFGDGAAPRAPSDSDRVGVGLTRAQNRCMDGERSD